MMSKFSDFLKDNKIDERRLLSASRAIEHLSPVRLREALAEKKAAAAGEDAKDKDKAAALKVNQGRPVTRPGLAAAKAGKTISGPTKSRLLRAVNRILEQRKKDAIDLRALF